MPATSQERQFRLAALAMIGSGLAFTVMVSFVKVARQDLTPLTLMFWRSVVALPVVWAVGRGRLAPHIARADRPWLLGRCVLGTAAMFGFYYASGGVGVGELGFLSKLQPILLALLAPLLLGRSERVPARVWWVIAVSFTGVSVLLGPKMQGVISWQSLISSDFAPYAAMALMASVCSALAHLCVRRLGGKVPTQAIVSYFQLFVGVVSLLLLGAQGGVIVPDPRWFPVLVGMGLSSVAGQLLLTFAYGRAKAGKVAAVSYVSPIWGVLIDAVYFGHPPTASVWVGGALIMFGGLSLLRSRST